jgi:2-polyprenyl-3-methyl-5-hydroxy-6-metoxy-1,4-benzoquinol methylase
LSQDHDFAPRNKTTTGGYIRKPRTSSSRGQVPPAAVDNWLDGKPHPEGAGGSWHSFWEEAREKQRIVRAEAVDYVSRLSLYIRLHERLRVMDFGCGTGHIAEALASRVSEVAVWDASQAVRARTAKRLASHTNITFLDLTSDLGIRASGCFDLIVSHSVVQYMSRDELLGWLRTWGSMLSPRGVVVLSDVISETRNTARELFDLVIFAARNRVLLGGLLEEASSVLRYTRTRVDSPLLSLSPTELTDLAARKGLQLEVLPSNLGHKSGRLAVALRHQSTAKPAV